MVWLLNLHVTLSTNYNYMGITHLIAMGCNSGRVFGEALLILWPIKREVKDKSGFIMKETWAM